jgi:cytochrome c oxidase assembly protein subunit 11
MSANRNDATKTPTGRRARRDVAIAAACGVFVAAMVGASYAAVPFYNWFCRVTGFNGTTQVATQAPAGQLGRKITVRFDANVSGGLPWKFAPERTSIEVRLGEVVTVLYNATNESARETIGQAGYNVSPLTVGAYFDKINCFCFTEQRLQAGERREMPVVFYVDPALAKDADGKDLDTITLSYTFYPARQSAKPVAESTGKTTGQL